MVDSQLFRRGELLSAPSRWISDGLGSAALAAARPLHAAALGLALAAYGPPLARSQATASPPPAAPASAEALIERLETAWQTRDLPGYLSLWRFAGPEAESAEVEFARAHFAAELTLLVLQPAASSSTRGARFKLGARVFSVDEPHARVEEWQLTIQAGPAGWAIAAREPAGRVDGLLHLSLDPQGMRADGHTLRLEDFELQMHEGTLFLPPASVGPTLIVFVGRGSVLVSPRPDAEREELRKFCGRPEMRERVRTAFIRIHPADLPRVLSPVRFEPDPQAAKRLSKALKVFEAQASLSFVLDASLPRSPWWLLPAVGDASVSFDTGRRGTLTFTVSRSEFESLSLFDRARRLQICLYPGKGGDSRYNEDAGRNVDVLHHDLAVRFEPDRSQLSAEARLRIRLHATTSTLRLRLDEALRVESVISREAGRHLFFRVRGQDSLVVALGALAAEPGEISLSVRYSGTLRPAPLEQEVQLDEGVAELGWRPLEDVLVYSNRLQWYPTAASDDYATATLRLDVPEGFVALTGGSREPPRTSGGRTLHEYHQDRPGKYISVAVGRLVLVGERAGPPSREAFGLDRTRDEAEKILKRSGDITGFFAEQFGPAPYASLRLAVIEGVVPGGHSPPGMVILSRRPPLFRQRLRDDPANFGDVEDFFLAHELAHQWWGHGVTGQNYHERWISEAFAQYAAALWVRRSQGERAFRQVLERMADWARRESEEGPISLGYRLGHIKGDSQIFRAVIYDKGALVLHMLHGIVGEEAFRTGLTRLQAEQRFQKVGTDEVRQALEAASGCSLEPYFEAWVFGTALPTLIVSKNREAGEAPYRTRVTLRAEQLPGSVPLQLTLAHRGGRETQRVELPPEGGSWIIETPEKPGKLEVNADQGLLLERIRKD